MHITQEDSVRKHVKEVGEKGAEFIKTANEGIALTKEGIEKYLAEVTIALKEMANAKAAYQYGSACLTLLGIGSKKDVLCIFAKNHSVTSSYALTIC